MSSRFGRIAALQAAFFVTASTYIAYAISIVVSAVVARSLGPADYGQYAYLVFIVGLLVMLANHGLTTSAIRFTGFSKKMSEPTGPPVVATMRPFSIPAASILRISSSSVTPAEVSPRILTAFQNSLRRGV